jgi:transposase
MYYSGIDLHKNMCMVTTLNESGIIVKQIKLPNDDYTILNYFFSLGEEHKAVVESTTNWYWLSDLLRDHQIDLVLAHAKHLKAISCAKVKTDKYDSHSLAQLLRLNLIPIAHQINPSLRGPRDLMRARLRLVCKKTSCLNSIHRILEKFNLDPLGNHDIDDLTAPDSLNQLNLNQEYQLQINILKEQIKLIEKQLLHLEKSLHPTLIPNTDVQILMQLPGIGKILAFTIYLEIDSSDRFKDIKNFYSYCRLAPGADNSNRKIKHKSGSKEGNPYLKFAFAEAAFRAIQHYPEIRQFYKNKLRKKHIGIARNLVAKELAKMCYYLLKYKTDYNNTFKGIKLSKPKAQAWPRLASPAKGLEN